MFIQVIEGTTRDPEALHERLDVWERDLRPGATGYLGSTGGCTTDGHCILVVRFESRDAARRNSERAEQTAWWQATEALFDGPVTFHDTDDVHVISHGNPDRAGFVQVMDGHVTDHDRAVALERTADEMLAELRPELLGAVTAFHGDGAFTEVAYFTSEEDARRGERMEMPASAQSMLAEWQNVMRVDHYYDLRQPWLASA